MFSELLSTPFAPFTWALGLLFGLMLLELVFALLGGSLMMGDGGIDLPDAPDIGELDIDLDGLDIPDDALELAQFEDAPSAGATGGIASLLGLGKTPFMIWLGSILLSFGLSGYFMQKATGGALPLWLATPVAAGLAVLFTRKFARGFARLIPQNDTESVSERHLGRRKGIVTQGTAARGRPAEVRVTDRFGNTHHLRAEPLRDEAQITQGTEVIVLRHKYDGGYMLVPLTTD